MSLISEIVSRVLSFFYISYIARYLGVDGYGILSFAIALTAIFGMFMDMGLNTITVREIAKEKTLAAKYIGNTLVMKLVLVTLTYLAIIISINLSNYPTITNNVVYLIGLSVCLNAFSSTFNSLFQAFEKMEFISIGRLLSSILMLMGAIVGVKNNLDILWFALLYLLISAIYLCYSVIIAAKKFALPNLHVDLEFMKRTLKIAWPMGAMAICIMIYFRIDVIMLSMMKDDLSVGLYSSAYQLSEISTIIPAMIVSSLFPVLSEYHEKSKDYFLAFFRISFKYLLDISLPMALIVTILAEPIVNIVFGNKFNGTVASLRILIWAAAIMYITILLGTTMITANKQNFSFKITVLSVILNILLNLMIIPKYGYIGASVTTVLTEAFGLIVFVVFLNRNGYKIEIKTLCIPPILALCIASIVSLLLIRAGLNIFIVSLVAAIVYSVMLYKIGISEEDINLIKFVFRPSYTKISSVIRLCFH